MIIGFTGTRQGMSKGQLLQLGLFFESNIIKEVHHGDCIGADRQFDLVAKRYSVKRVVHPPISSHLRAFSDVEEIRTAKEYLERNRDIVNECELLIAAPLTANEMLRSGTWATIRYAKKINREILIILDR